MQAQAVQALHTVTREGWLTPGDCISVVLRAGCAAEPHARASRAKSGAEHAIGPVFCVVPCLDKASAVPLTQALCW